MDLGFGKVHGKGFEENGRGELYIYELAETLFFLEIHVHVHIIILNSHATNAAISLLPLAVPSRGILRH